MDSDPESLYMTSQFILIGILILLNAFFAAAEMAMVSLNKSRISLQAEKGDKKAKLLLDLIEEPTKVLSTIQVGITLAGFFSSASAATGISESLGGYLTGLGISYGEEIALIGVTIILSYITLVLGELFPKKIALQNAEAVARFTVRPIVFMSKVARPFIKLLSGSTHLLVKLVGMEQSEGGETLSRAEISSLVEQGHATGVINETENKMINSIFKLEAKLANEVMTPRTEVYLINSEMPLESYLDELLQERYSRIPVYEGDIDHIVGILYMKDLIIEAKKSGFEHIDIRSILREPYFVPETKHINKLFKEMQRSKRHLAVLIDEYGGFSGIVSIEDLIEEVMGNIEDEYDEEEPVIQQKGENTYLVSGMIAIKDLNDKLNLEMACENYETLSGLLVDALGYIPEEIPKEPIVYDGLTFRIQVIKEKRIEKVMIQM